MNTRRTLAAALVFSLTAHTALIFPETVQYATRPVRKFASALYDDYQKRKIRNEREKLVRDARHSLKQGRLKLGEFMLKANDIDVREEGQPSDFERTGRIYARLQKKLLSRLEKGSRPQQVLPEVLRDIEYHGIPGGRMADALLEKGGSCEQIVHLSASLLYDSGHRDSAFVRLYRANADGVGHLAPIYVEGGREYNLMSGSYSDGKGVLFPASDLVEMYARAHGLASQASPGGKIAALPLTKKSTPFTLPSGRPSGFTYPPSPDIFDGRMPLYSRHALNPFNPVSNSSPAKNGAQGSSREARGWELEDFLNPKNIARLPSGVSKTIVRFQPLETPPKELAEGLSSLIERWRNSSGLRSDDPNNRWARAIEYGTLSGLYREAAWNFALLGRYRLMQTAQEQQQKILDESAPHLDNLGPMPQTVVMMANLVYLGKRGQDALFRLLESESGPMRPRTLAFLVADESSRKKALDVLERKPAAQQARLFSILRGVELEGASDFARAFSIFSDVTDRFATDEAEETLATGGQINPGQSLVFGNYRLKLELIEHNINQRRELGLFLSEHSTTTTNAIMMLLDASKKRLKKFKVREGQTVTLKVGGMDIPVKFIGMQEVPDDLPMKLTGSSPKRRPNIGILSKTPTDTFEALRKIIHDSCASCGLPGEWEDAITASAARWLLQNRAGRLNAQVFRADFKAWAQDRKKVAFFADVFDERQEMVDMDFIEDLPPPRVHRR